MNGAILPLPHITACSATHDGWRTTLRSCIPNYHSMSNGMLRCTKFSDRAFLHMRKVTQFLYRFYIRILIGPASTRSRHSVIGIVTCLQTGKSGFENRQDQETHLQYFQTLCGTHPPSYSIAPGVFRRTKRARAWSWPLTSI